jgi:hypothetical protein
MNRPRETCPGQAVLHAEITYTVRKAKYHPTSLLYRPTSDLSTPFLGRPLKTAHLLRWPASPLAATYLEYVSLGLRWAALHLSRFERPGATWVFQRVWRCTRDFPTRGSWNRERGSGGVVEVGNQVIPQSGDWAIWRLGTQATGQLGEIGNLVIRRFGNWELPNYLIAKLPSRRVAESPSCRLTQSPNRLVAKLPSLFVAGGVAIS